MKTIYYKLKTLIITKIASNYRKLIPIARNIKVQHINYMYEYNLCKLLNTLVKSYSPNCQHFNDRFIK